MNIYSGRAKFYMNSWLRGKLSLIVTHLLISPSILILEYQIRNLGERFSIDWLPDVHKIKFEKGTMFLILKLM